MNKTSESKYYGVYSTRGLGVYDNLYKLEINDHLFGYYKTKEFDWVDDAEEWAISNYNYLVKNGKSNNVMYTSQDIPKLNWFIRTDTDVSKSCFYAVYSTKGLGIYSDSSKLKQTAGYMGDYTMEKFNTRKEAERYAISGYNNLVLGTAHKEWTYHELPRISWFYFASKIDAGTALA